jgi:hypothetical protein
MPKKIGQWAMSPSERWAKYYAKHRPVVLERLRKYRQSHTEDDGTVMRRYASKVARRYRDFPTIPRALKIHMLTHGLAVQDMFDGSQRSLSLEDLVREADAYVREHLREGR